MKNILCLIAIWAMCHYGFVQQADAKMKIDVTIYLDTPILEEGGAIAVYPVPVSEEDWNLAARGENPILDDADMQKLMPVGSDNERLSVIVRSTFSIVQFKYPTSRIYEFHFAPLSTKNYPSEQFRTKLISVGGRDQELRSGFAGELSSGLQLIHFAGSRSSEEDSRGMSMALSFLEEDEIECMYYYNAFVCYPNDGGLARMKKILAKTSDE